MKKSARKSSREESPSNKSTANLHKYKPLLVLLFLILVVFPFLFIVYTWFHRSEHRVTLEKSFSTSIDFSPRDQEPEEPGGKLAYFAGRSVVSAAPIKKFLTSATAMSIEYFDTCYVTEKKTGRVIVVGGKENEKLILIPLSRSESYLKGIMDKHVNINLMAVLGTNYNARILTLDSRFSDLSSPRENFDWLDKILVASPIKGT